MPCHSFSIPFFTLLTILNTITCSIANNPTTPTPTYPWNGLLTIPTPIFESAFLPRYLNFTRDILTSPSISEPCKADLRHALSSLRRRHTWAVQLFQSWGHFPPTGLTSGTLTDFGDYDACLAIRRPLHSQYCTIDIALPMPPLPKQHNYYQKAIVLPEVLNQTLLNHYTLTNETLYRHFENSASVLFYVTLKIGFCLPSSCQYSDIESFASQKIPQLGLRVRRHSCETRPENKWANLNSIQITAIIVLVIILGLSLIAGIYDQQTSSADKCTSPRLPFLLWFSPLRNIRKLFQSSSKESELSCIHGLRFITLLWIITAHTLEWTSLNMYRDTFTIRERLSQTNLQIIYKAFYSVETFFYLSGVLTSAVTLQFTAGAYENFRYIEYLTLRWVRLTPQLGLFLLLTSLLPILFDGPIWTTYMSTLISNCGKNWWINLLYLQNVVDINNICAVHTWYLAADMQLHLLSLLPIVLLLLHRQFGLLFTKLLILACVCLSSVLIFINKFPPGHIITSKNDFLDEFGMPSDFVAFLYKPWNHASVFFIGFIFGAYIDKIGQLKKKIEPTRKYLLWALGSLVYLFCIYSTLPYVHGRPYDHWSAILFPLNRILWALMLSLTIYLCMTKSAGFLGALLSWSAFRPLSRMSYAIYLTHAWIVYIVLGTRRQLIDQSSRSLAFHLLATLLSSLLIGFAFNVLVETPIINALGEYKRNRIRNSTLRKENIREIEEEDTEKKSKDYQLLVIKTKS